MSTKRRRSRKSGVEGIEGSLLATPKKKKRNSASLVPKAEQSHKINCFKEVRVEYPIHLPPSCIGSPLPGVIKILGDHLMK